jgi:HK97 family phage portal protein
MGLFDRLFGHAPVPGKDQGTFRTLTAYSPTFTAWNGRLYESELVRSAIDSRSRHISKLKVEVIGSAKPALRRRLNAAPNEFQTWSQFLYRLNTILDMKNTAFIVPVYGEFGEVTGIYPILTSRCALVQYNGEPWIRYEFDTGEKASIRVTEVGIMTKFQYSDDFFGDSNRALADTMALLNIQRQGVEEAVKNSATYRFMARLNNFTNAKDLAEERKRFSNENLKADSEAGGLLLFPNTYNDIRQIESKPYTVDADSLKLIQTNVFNYFGVNDKILQNIATGDEWASFYEGAIEPFALQFSEVVSRLIFSERERTAGNMVMATANRLQYMSNADKLNVSAQMADRGIMTINEIREIWNLAPVEGGDVRILRGEYKGADAQEVSNDETE